METEKNISGISENLADSIKQADENQSEKPFLTGRRIAVSVSDSEDIEKLGLSPHHVKDFSIEMARYLFVNGAALLYGGDLRVGGYTELFSELSFQYKYLRDKDYRFVNYAPFPNSKNFTSKDKANFKKKQVELKILEVPETVGQIDREKDYDPFNNVADRYAFSECFTDMRIKMAADSDARILLGGKQKNFLGYLPGIFEEAFHSLKADQPVYLLGGFGGAAKSVISLIKGENPRELSNDFQFDTEFLREFKRYASDKASVSLDYDELNAFFRTHTPESISQKNGLTIDENQILFESTNIHELIFLILKGLKNMAGGK